MCECRRNSILECGGRQYAVSNEHGTGDYIKGTDMHHYIFHWNHGFFLSECGK